jgi:hypothetical protein
MKELFRKEVNQNYYSLLNIAIPRGWDIRLSYQYPSLLKKYKLKPIEK